MTYKAPYPSTLTYPSSTIFPAVRSFSIVAHAERQTGSVNEPSVISACWQTWKTRSCAWSSAPIKAFSDKVDSGWLA